MRLKLISILALLSLGSLSGTALAEGGYNSGRNSPLAPIETLIKEEKFQDAITGLLKLLEETPENADMLNLLAYSQRKACFFGCDEFDELKEAIEIYRSQNAS